MIRRVRSYLARGVQAVNSLRRDDRNKLAPEAEASQWSTFAHARAIMSDAEVAARTGNGLACLRVLRRLPFDDFGHLLISLPLSEYPAISAVLPSMASAEVQRAWTGNDGLTLLKQTNTFVRMVAQNFVMLRGGSLDDIRILDFGCGYGRILRSMLYFSDPERLHGCDPWDEAIRLCRESRVMARVALSEYLPARLPFDGRFDLIYAFSVFTHLSARATRCCLETLQRYIDVGGLIVITVRPIEYWCADSKIPDCEREGLIAAHRNYGFAFRPHDRAPVDGDITYGDTSMTADYIGNVMPGLAVRRIEHALDDPYQLTIFLEVDRH